MGSQHEISVQASKEKDVGPELSMESYGRL